MIDKILCHKEVTEDGQTVTKYLIKWKARSTITTERPLHLCICAYTLFPPVYTDGLA